MQCPMQSIRTRMIGRGGGALLGSEDPGGELKTTLPAVPRTLSVLRRHVRTYVRVLGCWASSNRGCFLL